MCPEGAVGLCPEGTTCSPFGSYPMGSAIFREAAAPRDSAVPCWISSYFVPVVTNGGYETRELRNGHPI
jgi:hypothetical protein